MAQLKIVITDIPILPLKSAPLKKYHFTFLNFFYEMEFHKAGL